MYNKNYIIPFRTKKFSHGKARVGHRIIHVIIEGGAADFPFSVFSAFGVDVKASEDFREIESKDVGGLLGEILWIR